ncbi:MAG: hypothetical protein PW792_16340 [Acidobacteriaceae bacterium]|nr:hypothetical protein [Acidobacteriaceae bacterium]
MIRSAVLFFSLCMCVATTGCGITGAAVGGPNDEIQGSLMGGQQPISGATITVWQAGSTGYGQGATKMASTTTDANGNFSFASSSYTCTSSNAPMYLTGAGGNPGGGTNANVMQLAVIGPCQAGRTSFFVMNEVSTAAAAIVLAPYMSPTLGSSATPDIGATCSGCASGTFNKGLLSAMNETLPAVLTKSSGQAVATHTTSAGITVTTEAAKINSIANILAVCVNTTGQTSSTETSSGCGQLFKYTTPSDATTRPYTTLQAALMMALYPYQNVSSLYNTTPPTPPFTGLTAAPSDWTVAVSYTSSAFGLGVNPATSSTMSVDANGSVWFPTNTASSHGLAYFDPTDQSFHGPYATTLTHPQYVAVSNTTTPSVYGNDSTSGHVGGTSISSPTTTGTSYATGDGSTLVSTGPLFVDNDGNVAFAGMKTATTATNYVLLSTASTTKNIGGSNTFATIPTAYSGYPATDYGLAGAAGNGASSACYGMYLYGNSSDTGTSVSSNTLLSTSSSPCVAGGVAMDYQSTNDWDYVMTASTLNQFCTVRKGCTTYSNGMSTPMGVAFDSANRAWIANAGNASVSILDVTLSSNGATYTAPSSVAYQHGTSHGGTATKPYGIAIDGSGNVWLSNAGCTTASCSATSFTLTEILGAASPVITPLSTVFKNSSFNTLPTN